MMIVTRLILLSLAVNTLLACTDSSGPQLDEEARVAAIQREKDNPNPTSEYCKSQARHLSIFLEGIQHFGNISPNTPRAYRACLENKELRAALLPEIKRVNKESERAYEEHKKAERAKKAAEREQQRKDQELVKKLKEVKL